MDEIIATIIKIALKILWNYDFKIRRNVPLCPNEMECKGKITICVELTHPLTRVCLLAPSLVDFIRWIFHGWCPVRFWTCNEVVKVDIETEKYTNQFYYLVKIKEQKWSKNCSFCASKPLCGQQLFNCREKFRWEKSYLMIYRILGISLIELWQKMVRKLLCFRHELGQKQLLSWNYTYLLTL